MTKAARMRRGSLPALMLSFLVTGLAACGGDDSSGGDLSAFCSKAQSLEASLSSIRDSVVPGDVAGAQAAFQQIADLLQDITDVAPAEIADEMNAANDEFQDVNSDVQDISSPTDFVTVQAEVTQAQQDLHELDGPITAFTQANCTGGASGASGAAGTEAPTTTVVPPSTSTPDE